MFEVGGNGHAAGKKQGGMSKEGREVRGPQSAVAGSQTEEGATRIALVSHLRALSWTDATQLQQDPNGRHSCFQYLAIKWCCQLPHVTFYPLQHVSEGFIMASAIAGLYIPNSGGHGPVAPQRAWPAHTPTRLTTACSLWPCLQSTSANVSVHQSDG